VMTPSPQQVAVLSWVEKGSGSLNVIARAGCGKSTLLIEISKIIEGRGVLASFNKAIAEELQSRVTAPNVIACTMHSLGFSLFRKIAKGKSNIDSRKVRNLARKHFPYEKPLQQVVCDAVSFGKQAGLGLKGLDYTEMKTWLPLFDHYDLWDEIPGAKNKAVAKDDAALDLGRQMSATDKKVLTACTEVYDESLEMCQERNPVIDFDDMILAPLILGDPVPTYDWFLGDEWQDANDVRRNLARFVLKPEGRAVFVADPAQSIYTFAGATVDSVERTKAEFQCVELPLSVTYRCPKAIVALAQTWVSDITAHESAPEGKVHSISAKELWTQSFDPQYDAILCRNTRPLLGIAKRLRKSGIDCVVEGTSGKGLIALASKWGEDVEIRDLELRLDNYRMEEVTRWTEKENEEKVEYVREKVEMLLDLCGELNEDDTVVRLIEKIENIFNDKGNRPNVLHLCTCHRSKGREWGRVFLVGRNEYMPSRWAKQDWEQVAEANLQYVAVTRVKQELVEVVVPRKKTSEDPEWWEL